MTERVAPEPDAFATCPYEGNILGHYAGTFESVYVLLHPFIKPVSMGADRFNRRKYPSRSSITKNCEAVSWAEVVELAGFQSIAAIDVGLRTLIGGWNPEFANDKYANQIHALIESHGIIAPPEGCFSDLLHDKVLQAIQGLDHQWVWVGDEFCTERKLHWIDDLKAKDGTTTSGHCNVFTPDTTLLWTTHWDSHFSFLCSSEANLLAIQERMKFEGFFCDPETEVYWSVHET